MMPSCSTRTWLFARCACSVTWIMLAGSACVSSLTYSTDDIVQRSDASTSSRQRYDLQGRFNFSKPAKMITGSSRIVSP